MYLTTDRLLLRPVEYMDIDQLVALWTDPEVTACVGGPRDPDEVQASLDEEVDSPPGALGMYPLIEKATGAVVGHCGLIEKEIEGRDEVELVYFIAKRSWGQGYAAEIGASLLEFAFRVLGLERVVSLIDLDNEGSKHVAERLGLHFEKVVARPDGHDHELWVIENPDATA